MKLRYCFSKLNNIFNRKGENKKNHTYSIDLDASNACSFQLENAKKFPNGVIIDQEIGTGSYWSLLYPEKDLRFFQIEDVSDFLIISTKWNKNTRLFVDSRSCNTTDSFDTIKSLLKLGFKNIVIIGSKTPSVELLKRSKCKIFIDKNEPDLKILEAIDSAI